MSMAYAMFRKHRVEELQKKLSLAESEEERESIQKELDEIEAKFSKICAERRALEKKKSESVRD